MKKVVIVSSSPRKNGNSDILANKFKEGVLSCHNEVEMINIRELNLQFCRGCLYCLKNDRCIINDSMNELYEKIQHADVIVFATPIYYYSVSGQLKTFLDRLNPLYPRKNKFTDVYLLMTSADEEEKAMNYAIDTVRGFLDCFENTNLKNVIKGVGVDKINDILKTPFPEMAYNMGREV